MIKLTDLSKTCGWAGKLEPEALNEVVKSINFSTNKNLLIGTETSDDAAVYKIDENKAIVSTLDFFTPVVDDPYTYGEIAAANSLSDVYAMGADPFMVLNIVCFPKDLPKSILEEILKGAESKVKEAGAVTAGGHSIDDDEPKFGLSVNGMVHPDKIWRNFGAKKGDALILTKPLGTGIINTANKAELASERAYIKSVKTMKMLNKYAYEKAKKYDIHAATDVTGFGFLGHAYEMAHSSEVTFEINQKNVKYISEAEEYAKLGLVPAGSYRNRKYMDGKYILNDVEGFFEDILFDPQTSGGLLFSLDKAEAEILMYELNSLPMESSIVGEVKEFDEYYIKVT